MEHNTYYERLQRNPARPRHAASDIETTRLHFVNRDGLGWMKICVQPFACNDQKTRLAIHNTMDDLQPVSILLLGDDEVGKSTFLSYGFVYLPLTYF